MTEKKRDTRKKDPTFRQRMFAKEVAKHHNPVKAAKIAYPGITHSSANTTAYRNMHNPKILNLINKYVPDEKIGEVLKRQMDAKKQTKFGLEDDNMAQLKATDMVLKVKGAYPSDAMKLGVGSGSTINFIIEQGKGRDISPITEAIDGEEVKED